jgi:hypothetical protein
MSLSAANMFDKYGLYSGNESQIKGAGFVGPLKPGGTIGGYSPISTSSNYNPAYQGSVLGAGTDSGSGGGSGGGGTPTQETNQNPQGPDPYQQYLDQMYGNLSNSYNQLSGQLDPMRDRRAGEIEGMYNTGLQGIDLQQQAGQQALEGQRGRVTTNQTRNLKDLSNAISQSFNTFSNQLGVMGAGDSSAAKTMMPYALSRLEAGQRGNIARISADKMGEIDERETQLNNAVMQEKNKLEQAKMGEMSALGEWFDNAKMQISQMKLADQRAAGEQAMQIALQRLQSIEQNFANRQNALQSWAMSNAQNLAQLQQNMSAVTDPRLLGQLPQYSNPGASLGNVQAGNFSAPVGFGFGNDELKRLGLA